MNEPAKSETRYDIDTWDNILVEKVYDEVVITNAYDPAIHLDVEMAQRMIKALQSFVVDSIKETEENK